MIYTAYYDTPIGQLQALCSATGICMLEFDNESRRATHARAILKAYEQESFVEQGTDLLKKLEVELREYFEGSRTQFDVPLDLIGTDFQVKVWKALLQVPFGVTRSYLEQSKIVGNTKAIRAVAKANGENRISIVVPCHRIIGSDGSLTGYGGELWRKAHLLELESNQMRLF